MIVKDQVKKIKEYLLVQEAEAQLDPDAEPLNDEEFNDRVQTIKNIGPTMNDVAMYCYEDGWDQEAVCSLIFKVVFGETWNTGLHWPSP